MIKHTNSYETSDGQEFTMLAEAKTHEIELLLRKDEVMDTWFKADELETISTAIVLNGPAIAEILKEEV